MPMYRKPTDKQRQDILAARKMTREGIEGQDDLLSAISTTMAKAARDQEKMGRRRMDRIPEEVRNYEMEEGQTVSPFKKGGKVSSASKRADGCAIRGKTRGKMV